MKTIFGSLSVLTLLVSSLAQANEGTAPEPGDPPESVFMVTVILRNGTHVRSEYRETIKSQGIVYRAVEEVAGAPQSTLSTRVRIRVPSEEPYLSPLSMSVRYGCRENREDGVEVFQNPGVVESPAIRFINRKLHYEADLGGIRPIFDVCGERSVSVKIDLFPMLRFPGTLPVATFVVYLSPNEAE